MEDEKLAVEDQPIELDNDDFKEDQLDSPPVEEAKDESGSETPASDQNDEPTPEQPQPDTRQEDRPSPRVEKRIRDLSAKVREAHSSQPPRSQEPAPVAPVAPTPLPPFQPGQEVGLDDINNHVMNTAQTLSEIKENSAVAQLRQEIQAEREFNSAMATFNEDLRWIEGEYSVLNENSPEFDVDIAGEVQEAFTEALKTNPRARFADTAQRMMKVYKKASAKSSTPAAASERSSQALAGDPTPKAKPVDKDQFLEGFDREF